MCQVVLVAVTVRAIFSQIFNAGSILGGEGSGLRISSSGSLSGIDSLIVSVVIVHAVVEVNISCNRSVNAENFCIIYSVRVAASLRFPLSKSDSSEIASLSSYMSVSACYLLSQWYDLKHIGITVVRYVVCVPVRALVSS